MTSLVLLSDMYIEEKRRHKKERIQKKKTFLGGKLFYLSRHDTLEHDGMQLRTNRNHINTLNINARTCKNLGE